MPALPRRFAYPLLLALALFAIWARVWMTWAEPMWLDEAYSAYAAGQGWHFLWAVVPRYETHPPFYYSILRAWTLVFGDGLIAQRMLGILAGIAAVPLAAWLAWRMARYVRMPRTPVVLAAAALAAASPILIWMSRDVRPYALMILAYGTAIAALLAIARRRRQGSPLAGRAFTLYIACSALLLWLHNLGPLYAAALGCALLVLVRVKRMTGADWGWFVGGHVIAILLWLPALLILLDQAPEWVRATWLKFSTRGLFERATMIFAGPADDMRIACGVLLACGIATLWHVRGGRRLLAALLILALVPLTVSLLVSATIAPVFIVRTMTALAIPAFLLFAAGFGGARPLRLIAGAALAWLLVSWIHYDLRPRGRPEGHWYRAIDWLQPRFRPGDVVFAYPNEGALPFDRAVQDRGLAMPSRPIPAAIPALNPPPGSWYVSGSRGVPSLDRKHLRAIAEEPATRAVPTIWLLRLGPWAYDKDDVFLDELSHGRVEVGRYRDKAIDIVGLRAAPSPDRHAGS